MAMVPRSELEARLASLQLKLCQEAIDAALIVQNADLLYFGGIVNKAYFYIPATGAPVLLAFPGAERIRNESEFPHILDITEPSQLPDIIRQLGYRSPEILGLEADVLPAALHDQIASLFPSARIEDVSGLIRRTRMVKSMWEIEQIQAACRMGMEIFEFVPQVLRQQMWEIELSGYIERFSRQLGHPGYIRSRGFNQEMTYTMVLSGPEAATPGDGSEPLGGRGVAPAFPHGPTHRLIGKNEPVIVEFVAWTGGYVADMTRTYCIGKLPSHMEHAYDTAMAIQDLLKKEARAGAVCGELWTAVRQLVRTNGLCEHFMGMSRRVSFIAHGVGIEIDELPVLSPRNAMVLLPNMVIAVEPKFVFPDGAVGLENTFVVGPEGLVSLIESQDGVYILHEH